MIFEIIDKSLSSRIGRIYTKKGFIETPSLLPVLDVNFNPEIIDWIKKLGYKVIITNAYLLWKKLNKKIIDVHNYFSFHYPIMTDSGGYQVLKYNKIDITPKISLEYQLNIKSDICVFLDYPTGFSVSKDFAKKSVKLTLNRAKFASKYLKDTDSIIVAPIQGGIHINLLKYCAKKMKELGYEMYAIGSPTGLMEKYLYSKVLQMILTAKTILGPAKPIHLFGAGHPMFFSFIIALGIDTFDSAAYSLYAKYDRYLTRSRTYKLDELSYFPCNCDICRKFDVNEFKSLNKNLRRFLLEKHNLYVSLEEVKHIKVAIKEGTLWHYLEEKSKAHVALYEALLFLKKHIKFLEKYNPLTKVNVRGIFFYDNISSSLPDILTYYDLLLNNYKINEKSILIFLPFLKYKPFSRSKEVTILKEFFKQFGELIYNKIRVIFVGYPFIFIPLELAEIYPTSQWEGYISSISYRNYFNKLIKHVLNNINIERAIIFNYKKYTTIFNKIINILVSKNIPFLIFSFNNFAVNLTINKEKIKNFIL